jgi:lipoprotein-anchoring transpeptidase ErfK/SrfK
VTAAHDDHTTDTTSDAGTTAGPSPVPGAGSDAHAPGASRPRRRGRPLLLAGVAVVAALGIGVGAAAATTASWGEDLRDGERLLAGITIAGVDVSGATVADAVAEVDAAIAPQLDHEVTVTAADRSWTVTPRELGATSDAQQVVADAFEATTSASLLDLARLRFRDEHLDLHLDVTVDLERDAVAARVDELADELDHDPTDAELTWVDGSPELTGSATGLLVDRQDATTTLAGALDGAADTVELPTATLEPRLTTAMAETARDATVATIESALDRAATVTHAGSSWSVTARDLGAVPDADPVLAAALDHVGAPVAAAADAATLATPVSSGGDATVLDVTVPLDVDRDAVAAFVADIAAGIDQPARDATVDLVGGRLEITAERSGLAVDRDAAVTAVEAALEGNGASTVELGTVTTSASITSASFGTVLVVRQGARTLEMYEGGEVTRSWPVAVGSGGHPTPTGTFTVGAKRFEPTWVNPSPDGWGEDMPASIGPGDPANPLGARAINWNRGGGDTLIRFHGTPNESSIGQAVSKGCVRMYNADVAELYDLVPSGTTIISVD